MWADVPKGLLRCLKVLFEYFFFKFGFKDMHNYVGDTASFWGSNVVTYMFTAF